MGSQEPEKTEVAAFGDPVIPGKGLSEGPSRGAGRCHGYKKGPPDIQRGHPQPTESQPSSGFCLHTVIGFTIPTGQVVLASQVSVKGKGQSREDS